MMRLCILKLLCFLALSASKSYAADLSPSPTLYFSEGETARIGRVNSDHDIIRCEVRTNNGTDLILYPKDFGNEERIQIYSYDKCRTNIYKISVNDTGMWKVRTIVNKLLTEEESSTSKPNEETHVSDYNIQVRKEYLEKPVIPATRSWVYPGQQVIVHLKEKLDDLIACKLLDPEEIEHELINNTSANITISGECGFRMTVRNEYAGKWTLIAELKNDTAFYGTFEVLVRNVKDLTPQPVTYIFKRGEEADIDVGKQLENIKMCIIEDPHGVRTSISTGSCNHRIDLVTENHDGIWKAYYGLEGIERLIQQNITVSTYDISPLNSSIDRLPNGDINLLCQIRSRSSKFCSFIRPDGEILHMTFAVGNNKYEYYGNGTHSHINYITGSTSITDCGVTIHNPDQSDYGAWRCLIRVDAKETLGRVLKVVPAIVDHEIVKSDTTAQNIYVKIGEPLKMKCTADEVLSYCWFRSPNDTVLKPSFKYGTPGLEFGNCIGSFEHASPSDDGEWTCHMGVANGPELEANFKVIVEETNLRAEKELIYINNGDDFELKCQPLPGLYKVIEDCRWVNPSGHGIHIQVEGRYYTSVYTSPSECSIFVSGAVLEEDVGRWTCHARFNYDQEEGSASIMVIAKSYRISCFTWISFIFSLLLFVSSGFLGYVFYKRKPAINFKNTDLEKIVLDVRKDLKEQNSFENPMSAYK